MVTLSTEPGDAIVGSLARAPKALHASVLSLPESGSVETDAMTNARASEVLATWRTFMPSRPDNGEGDKEDFWEMAYRLHAAIHSGGNPVRISINDAHSRVIDPRTLEWGAEPVPAHEGYTRASESPQQNALYGPLTRFGLGNLVSLPQEELATSYARLAPFRAHSGRRVDLVSVGGGWDESEEVGVAVQQKLREYRDAGVTDAAIKSVSPKRFPLTVFPIAEGENPLPPFVEDSISECAFQLMGRPEAFILQSRINVQYEYRMFVVDGVPVTGAGNIEEFTPLDSTGAAFDHRMRQFRGPRSEVQEQRERLERYRSFSSYVAAEFATEGLVTYVLDVATDGDTGEPIIVELNGLLNSGLFASDPLHVTKRLVSA